MQDAVDYICGTCPPNGPVCADRLVAFSPRFQEYGLIVHGHGSTLVTQDIAFCPWCGASLPASQRDAWFDELERRGYDDPQDAPLDMTTDAWLTSAVEGSAGQDRH